MYSISYNYTQHTSDPGITIQAYPLQTTDFSVKEDTAKRCVLTNMTSPLGSPEQVEYQFQDIADVYNGTGIDRALWTPSKQGVAFFVKVQETWSAIDSENATAPEYALPVTATIRIKLPKNGLITTEDVENLFKRLATALYPDNTGVIAKLLRGALNPKD
jgi:hypothetical protein